MKPSQLFTLLAALSFPWLATAQNNRPPARLSLPNNPEARWLPEVDPLPSPEASAAPLAAAGDTRPAAPATAPAVPAAASPIPAPAAEATPEATTGGGIRMNFQGAQLSTVLNYLSEAAGFVIVQDVPVTGTVNIVSRQPISPDEAVDLLNAVLVDKNYLALRSGRILKIVSRTDAQKRDLPVITGSDPTQIPKKDNMVTQILPVRYAEVSKLIDNLRPLLSADAAISANDASNAIILTDTQTHIRRMAEIIRALDTSISGISTIHVFPLRYADAKSLAGVLTQLFEPQQSTTAANNRQGNNQGGFPGFGGFGGGGRGGGGNAAAAAQPASEARKAASRVVAVPDDQSNSVIVSAPDEYMATIAEVVSRLDTSITDVTETRIFRLLHADATELSAILTTLYSDSTSTGPTTNRGNNQPGRRNGGGQQGQQQAADQPSERALQQAKMVAVADPRTNSIIVSASHETMNELALTVGRLDASDSKKQHVHIYTLENADPDNVASILRGMFTVDASSSSTQSTTNVLTQRTTNGASSDVANTLNSSGSTGSGTRGR